MLHPAGRSDYHDNYFDFTVEQTADNNDCVIYHPDHSFNHLDHPDY